MDAWLSGGRRFEVVMASDVARDGVGLELTDLDEPSGPGPVLEVFWSDKDATMTFTADRSVTLPFDIVSRFLVTAERALPPAT